MKSLLASSNRLEQLAGRNTSQDAGGTSSNENPAMTGVVHTKAMQNGNENSKNTANSNSLSCKNAKPFSPSSNGNTQKTLRITPNPKQIQSNQMNPNDKPEKQYYQNRCRPNCSGMLYTKCHVFKDKYRAT